MPGFGKGPFGHVPFGHWKWSKQVLYDFIPEIYKTADAQEGFALRKFTDGLRPSYDNLKRKIQQYLTLREPLTVRTSYNETERLVLGPKLVEVVEPEQRGSDGVITPLQEFYSKLGRFRAEDLGKEITIRGSKVIGNNRIVVIVAVIDLHHVITNPPLPVDAGPLLWELRPPVEPSKDEFTVEVRGGNVGRIAPGWILSDGFAEFEVLSRRQFAVRGGNAFRTEREGSDGFISDGRRFRSPGGNFSGADVGKHLFIDGAGIETNNGVFEIVSVDLTTSPPDVRLAGFMSKEPGPFFWALLPYPQLDVRGRAVLSGVVEQEGFDAQLFAASDEVVCPSGSFKAADVGKYMTILNTANNQDGTYKVLAVINPNRVQLDHLFGWNENLRYWGLRTPTLTGEVEKAGKDLVIETIGLTTTTLRSASGAFLPTDVDATIDISLATIPTNNGSFTITAVPDEDRVTINAVLTGEAGPFAWAVRAGNFLKVRASAPSMIQRLAPDFGIEVDNQESEARQRSWVANVTRWIDRKGHASSYRIIGLISGFNVTVLALYRLSLDFVAGLPTSNVYYVGDGEPGRFGTDGKLFLSGGLVHFTAATAKFKAGDIGRQIEIRDSVTVGNNKLYSIDQFVSATEVVFRPIDLATTPDYGPGGTDVLPKLRWAILRIFTDLPPLRPRHDDFDSDALPDYIANNPDAVPELVGKQLKLDMYCWDPTFAALISVDINSVTFVTGSTYRIRVTGQAGMISDYVRWYLQDDNGTGDTFTLESQVTLVSPGVYDFDVLAQSTNLPIVGRGMLRYRCVLAEECGYCKSSSILAIIESGTIANESGVAIERVLERVLDRMEEVEPAHVQLIPRFQTSITVTLNITVNTAAGLEAFATIIVPLTALYDEFPGDEVISDTFIYVTVTTPP